MTTDGFLIDGDAVAQAYAVTGLRPIDGLFLDHLDHETGRERSPTCGCPLAALYLALGGKSDDGCVSDWAGELLGDDYADGFISGFDGNSPRGDEDLIGYANGRALRTRFLGADA